jgi:hypothetical protein
LPRSVLNGMKPKALRKLIQQHFKKVAALSELECMFKFFDLLRAYYRFDQERFICALGVSNDIYIYIYIYICICICVCNKFSYSLFIILALIIFVVQLSVKLVNTRRTSHRTGLGYILHGSSRRDSGTFPNHVPFFS